MDDGTELLAGLIGARVRAERQQRRWTLDQLADAAAVSRRAVVNIEQGTTNPSVGMLLRISDALGVALPALVSPTGPEPVTVTRAGEGAELWTGANGGRGVLVASTEPPDVVELWEWTLAPGDRHDSEAHPPGTTELIHVISGSIIVEAGAQTVRLRAGDALRFPGDVAHAYAHAGSSRARFALTVYEPGVGAAERARVRRG